MGFKKNKALIIFESKVTEVTLSSFITVVEDIIKHANVPIKVSKKVYNVSVEMLHNLYHHGNSKDKDNVQKFVFMKNDKHYIVETTNSVSNSVVRELGARIDYTNTLDKNQIRDYYREILSNGKVSDKGGGGLGFIDMARKSGNEIDYKFEKIGADHSLFTLKVKIDRI